MALGLDPDAICVLVVHEYLPHYRYDVFRELQQDSRINMSFLVGAKGRDGIAEIPVGGLDDVTYVTNKRLGPFLWQRGVIGHIRKSKFDVVIFQGDVHYLSTWTGAIWSRLTGTKVLLWTIGWHRPESGIKLIVRRLFYGLANHLLFYGNHAKSIATRAGLHENSITVIYNSSSSPAAGLPIESHEFYQRLNDIKAPLVGAVIRLTPQKRLDLLIKAVRALRQEGSLVEVLLVGDGPEANSLRMQAERSNVPLHMLGAAYSKRALAAVYERLSVTVVPSLAGLTATQSMLYGVPVVTHNNPDHQVPESEAIHDGITGALYVENSVESLTNAIRPFLNLKEGQRERLANRCREEVSRNWTALSQRDVIIKALQNVITNARE